MEGGHLKGLLQNPTADLEWVDKIRYWLSPNSFTGLPAFARSKHIKRYNNKLHGNCLCFTFYEDLLRINSIDLNSNF